MEAIKILKKRQLVKWSALHPCLRMLGRIQTHINEQTKALKRVKMFRIYCKVRKQVTKQYYNIAQFGNNNTYSFFNVFFKLEQYTSNDSSFIK